MARGQMQKYEVICISHVVGTREGITAQIHPRSEVEEDLRESVGGQN
jgi:hypothetical protein